MKKKEHVPHKAKYYLKNYECGKCSTGLVQIHSTINRQHIVTTTVSGCLDCGYDYGIKQAQTLNKYTREDIVWA